MVSDLRSEGNFVISKGYCDAIGTHLATRQPHFSKLRTVPHHFVTITINAPLPITLFLLPLLSRNTPFVRTLETTILALFSSTFLFEHLSLRYLIRHVGT
ncbi:hypothetical protein I7I53_02797 [Histoplasma capsulatum var. duboisii H88]|uniref:Uncharacterized protein n=1 Tax=Ajellomyces capsulatus (strain H88) TaxID=544711 RepID=A0A8A1LPK6_AJEC8|nr:hypothetical protein I7I53_02797 [Histoplasma capsulatum var. duboisii H88]